MKSEMKSEQVEIQVDEYLQRFETDAAGYLVDELPHEFVHKFLSYLQKRVSNEIDPFKIPKPKMDPNDPHLHVEETKTELNDDKKRSLQDLKSLAKPQAPA